MLFRGAERFQHKPQTDLSTTRTQRNGHAKSLPVSDGDLRYKAPSRFSCLLQRHLRCKSEELVGIDTACDISIARATGCAYPHEEHGLVTPPQCPDASFEYQPVI